MRKWKLQMSIMRLYEPHGAEFDRERGRSLVEKVCIDRFLSFVRLGGTLLDIGCGMGEPIARYRSQRAFRCWGSTPRSL